MLSFFSSHWSEIVAFVGALSSVIVSFVSLFTRKNKTNLLEILSEIPQKLAQIDTLCPPGSGVFKLDLALAWIAAQCKACHIEFDEHFFRQFIEEVLEAPKKK